MVNLALLQQQIESLTMIQRMILVAMTASAEMGLFGMIGLLMFMRFRAVTCAPRSVTTKPVAVLIAGYILLVIGFFWIWTPALSVTYKIVYTMNIMGLRGIIPIA